MARKQRKGNHGTGKSVGFKLDANDIQEAKALAMSQILASKHGRRKSAIVEVLSAMYDYYEMTGQIVTPVIPGTFTPQAPRSLPSPAIPMPRQSSQRTVDEPAVVVTTAKKASAQEVGKRMTASFGAFFD